MNKQKFIELWVSERTYEPQTIKEFISDFDSVISEAIAEHEQGKWRKYPEEKPEKGFWFVQFKTGGFGIWSSGNWREWKRYIIAFRELPEPFKQEGGEG